MYQEIVLVYPGTALAYPGTDISVPGTSQPMEIDYVSVKVMEIDQAVFAAREVPRVYYRDVSNHLKARRCSGKFIRGSVDTTLHPKLKYRKYSGMGLLADGTARSRGLGPEVQWMSDVCPPDSSAGISIEDYPDNLALRCLGPGYGRGI
jgi:hypothetical protein